MLGGRTPTFEDLTRLTYTSQVTQESMRLYPPFWFLDRTAHGPDEIGGYPIPAGAQILLSPTPPAGIRTSGRCRGVPPRTFEPAGVAARPRHSYSLSAPAEDCIGRHLALMEMQLILAMVASATVRGGRPVLRGPQDRDLAAGQGRDVDGSRNGRFCIIRRRGAPRRRIWPPRGRGSRGGGALQA